MKVEEDLEEDWDKIDKMLGFLFECREMKETRVIMCDGPKVFDESASIDAYVKELDDFFVKNIVAETKEEFLKEVCKNLHLVDSKMVLELLLYDLLIFLGETIKEMMGNGCKKAKVLHDWRCEYYAHFNSWDDVVKKLKGRNFSQKDLLNVFAELSKTGELKMYQNKKALCKKPVWERERGDVKTDGLEDDGTGGKVRVERFSDGSSTYHGGGPCGDRKSDKFGREC